MSRLFIFFVLIISPLFAAAQTFEKTVSIPRPGENDKRYFYLAFDVPNNTRRLTVSYAYDKKDGANVLDLGVFDPAFDGSESDLKGFRGWSGGRRSTIFIDEKSATNGYVAGKIPPGVWRVVFGLYKVAPEGVDVKLTVRFNEIDRAAAGQLQAETARVFDFPKTSSRTAPPVAHGYTWFRGDLHMHTFYSDGNWTLKGLLDFAESNNLDFVGLTEHNTFAHHAELDRLSKNYKNLLVLRGEEVTTYGGHFNVWGLDSGDLVDFRVTPKDARRLQAVVDGVHRKKLVASINHPTGACGGCAWSYGDWTKMDAVEIWNGAWDPQDEAALKQWDEFLQAGRKITAIGSSDTHTPPAERNQYATNLAVGAPTVHAGMKKLTRRELFDAVKAGRIWIGETSGNQELEFTALTASPVNLGDVSPSPDGKPRLAARAVNFPAGATVSLISNGQVLQKERIEQSVYAFSKIFDIAKDAYFRIEIRDAEGRMLALTNPIYISVKK